MSGIADEVDAPSRSSEGRTFRYDLGAHIGAALGAPTTTAVLGLGYWLSDRSVGLLLVCGIAIVWSWTYMIRFYFDPMRVTVDATGVTTHYLGGRTMRYAHGALTVVGDDVLSMWAPRKVVTRDGTVAFRVWAQMEDVRALYRAIEHPDAKASQN